MLILGVIHIPLPQADYHNIRHHDEPGEICAYHDHLLRWHPTASRDDDVSMLHWHWFVPLEIPVGPGQGPDQEHQAPGSGLALHAQVGDWPEPDWTGDPVLRPDARGRLVDRLSLGQSGVRPAYLSVGLLPPINPQAGCFSASPSDGAGPLRATLTVLLQRWNC